MPLEEVTHVSWFTRIARAMMGAMIGGLLVVGGVVLLVWNEGNAIKDIKANKEIEREVSTVASGMVDDANDGKLVHVTGKADTEEVLRSNLFGLEEVALNLTWTAEIYQWVEKEETETVTETVTDGGEERTVTTYSYDEQWVETAVDSSQFAIPKGHENNTRRRFKSGRKLARKVTLDAFRLPMGLVERISNPEPLPIQNPSERAAQWGQVTDGTFHTGDLENPRVGDERVNFTVTRPLNVSVMAQQVGDSFVEYMTESGKGKFLISNGTISAAQMVEAEKDKAAFLRWALRACGAFLLFIGFWFVLAPLSTAASIIPFLGWLVGLAAGAIAFFLSAAISLVVIGLSWFYFRPLLGIPMLIGALVCFVLVLKQMPSTQQPKKLPKRKRATKKGTTKKRKSARRRARAR